MLNDNGFNFDNFDIYNFGDKDIARVVFNIHQENQSKFK